jgi:hypothetical protein
MKAYLASLLFLGLCPDALAQPDSTQINVGIGGFYGILVPHSTELKQFSTYRPVGIEVELSRIRTQRKSWEQCNCYSNNGISAQFFDFGYRDVLGQSYSLALFGEPQILIREQFRVGLRGAIGPAYVSRVYHDEHNPENIFFSAHMSGLLQARVTTEYSFTNQWTVQLSASFSHISNGGSKQPNKGMNFALMGLGARYLIHPITMPRQQKTTSFDKKMRAYGGLSYNSRKLTVSGPSSEIRKPVVGAQVGAFKPFASMHAAGLALEGTYDGALKSRYQIEEGDFDHRSLALLARHHLLFGKFDFSQAMGVYLYRNQAANKTLYQRYALQYFLTSFLQMGFSLKAHGHVAEQMDVRLMVVF